MQANPRTSEAAQAARNAGRAVAGAQRSAAYYNERFNQPRIPGAAVGRRGHQPCHNLALAVAPHPGSNGGGGTSLGPERFSKQ
eukprot:SAG31_NODE_8324_length_1474_cov_3.586182_1_plen_83_part_00